MNLTPKFELNTDPDGPTLTEKLKEFRESPVAEEMRKQIAIEANVFFHKEICRFSDKTDAMLDFCSIESCEACPSFKLGCLPSGQYSIHCFLVNERRIDA